MGLSEYQKNRLAYINDGRPLPPKKKYVIPKKSAKRIQKEKEQGIEIVKPKKAGWFDKDAVHDKDLTNENVQNGVDLFAWFVDQRKFMTGKCSHCGGKSQKHDDKTFHYSIAHLLPKAYFPSIATHSENWVELCYYGNSCHTNFDNHMIDITELNCFDEVISKITKLYPHIAKEERRRIPAILLEYIKTEQ